MGRHTVLVADADPRSLRILEVALRKAGFTVGTAADGPEALRRIQRTPPDLVVSEAQLPGADGYTLCKQVRGDEKVAGIPFLMTSADRDPAARQRALDAGADELLLKPLLIKELVTRVRLLLEQRDQQRLQQRGAPVGSISGSVADLGLVDLFQSLENWRKTAVVVCESKGRTARVWAQDGQIVDAELLPLTGDFAFFRLLNWDTGDFRVEFGAIDRERRIEGGTQTLLLEGMRRLDEVARLAERLPMHELFSVDTPALLKRLQDLPDEVNGVIRLFDGHRSIEQVVEASPIDDLSTLATVERLLADGILAQPQPHAGPKPSLQEWLGVAVPGILPPVDLSPEPEPAPRPEPPPPPAASPPVAPPAHFDANITDKIRAPAAVAATVERVLFPPLRGVRRERLRHEAEEVRAAIAAGKPVRLVHAVELPPWSPEGAPPAPQNGRRVSPAVSDEAKRLTSFEPLAIPSPRTQQPAREKEAPAPPPPRAARELEITAPGVPAPVVPPPPPPPPVEPVAAVAAPAPPPQPAVVARPVRHLGAVRDESDDLPPFGDDRPTGRDAPVRPRPVWRLWATAAAIALAAVGVVVVRTPRTDNGPPPPAPVAKKVEPPPAPARAAVPAPPPAAVEAKTAEPEATAAPVKPKTAANADEFVRAMTAGDQALKRGKYRQAAAEFEKAVEANRSSVPALLALGDAWLESDRPAKAIEPLRRAVSLDPRNGRAHLLLGTAHQTLSQNREAIAAYERYLMLDPSGEFARDVRSILANLSR